MTRDLLELSEWLQQLGVTHVALESTGVYWMILSWAVIERRVVRYRVCKGR